MTRFVPCLRRLGERSGLVTIAHEDLVSRALYQQVRLAGRRRAQRLGVIDAECAGAAACRDAPADELELRDAVIAVELSVVPALTA